MKRVIVFLLAVFLLASCKDKIESISSNSEIEKSYRYFPLVKGSYVIYDVDSIIHDYADDNTSTPDSLIYSYHYQVKETVDSSFIDGEGAIAWYISRYRKDADTLPWDFSNVWVSKRTNTSAQRVEDNVRYIKLSFPVNSNSSWNGNAFNIYQEEDYSYDGVNVPLTIGNFRFDSSLTVLQKDEINALHTILKKEKYVCGVGMVYKQNDSLNVNGLQQITNGIEFRETLKDYFPR